MATRVLESLLPSTSLHPAVRPVNDRSPSMSPPAPPRTPVSPALVVLLLLAAALAGCLAGLPGEGAGGAGVGDGLGDGTGTVGDVIDFTKVHTPEEITDIVEAWPEELDAAHLDSGVSVDVIGTSVEGRPLHQVVLGDGPHVLWVVGRQHGNEPTGGEAILQVVPLLADEDAALPDDAPPVLKAVLEHRELLLDRVTLVIVPVGNPDGSAAYQRANARGQDLNRDHWLFTQPESRAMRDAFWEHWPDSCIDLHNEGLGSYDWDAFMPDGLPESEMQDALERQSWLTTYEVDAAGGYGGGPNENYVLLDDPFRVENPTTYHPGTHDMFCSLRGAPGWTPEGAITGGDNGVTDRIHDWSTRLHAVTVATALLDAAGLYDGYLPPHVDKDHAVMDGAGADHLVDVPLEGDARIQVVWREDLPLDKNPAPVAVTVTGPGGEVHVARKPLPEAFTANVALDDAEPGTYHVAIRGPAGLEYEVRTYLTPNEPQHVLVQRLHDGALRVEAHAPLSPHVTLTEVVDADVDPARFDPAPDEVHAWNGSVEQRPDRLGLVWHLDLVPGQVVLIETPDEGNPGPFRWTAVAGDGRVFTGVEAARSTE